MAIQHISIKNGARGNGAKHARYVGGEGSYSDREDVAYIEDGNLPKWASTAVAFFNAADEYERDSKPKLCKTRDGQEYDKIIKGRVYKEIEAAIPREAIDPIQWAKDFVYDLLGDDHTYRLAVHDKEAAGGGRNVHMHLMFSTRIMDGFDREPERFFKRANVGKYVVKGETRYHAPGAGGAKKSDYWNSRECVPTTRKRFEGHVQRVAPDFKMERSEAPEQKIGPGLKRAGEEYQKGRAERVENVTQLRAAKKERAEIDNEILREQGRDKEVLVELSKDNPNWSRFKNFAASDGSSDILPPPPAQVDKPSWSRFKDFAASDGSSDVLPPPPSLPAQVDKPSWSRFKDFAASDGSSDVSPPSVQRETKAREEKAARDKEREDDIDFDR